MAIESVPECPCKGCEPPIRYSGCHSDCPVYNDWKKLSIARNKELRMQRYIDTVLISNDVDSICRTKKRRRDR